MAAVALLAPASLASAQNASRAVASILADDAAPAATPLRAALTEARALTLDVAAARAALAAAPAEGTTAAPLVLALPLPDGRTQRFAVRETAVMAPALAARYPSIKTYAGVALPAGPGAEAAPDPRATVRLDLTPAGFHAQILSARFGTVYIEPARRGDTDHYLSFFRHAMRRPAGSTSACLFEPTKADAAAAARNRAAALAAPADGANGPAGRVVSGAALRTYRLAVSATGEYLAFHGGTRPLTQAAIVTSVNRVVGVYETELAVRMILVPNNDTLIYLNAATDPFTNDDGGAMLGENQQIVDASIGSENYDIGHVFSTNGGGVAGYAVVCNSARKAQGVTGTGAPVGDAFDIDYVAHEIGHQFSGSHPFNSATGSCNGNRSGNTAWEPGSGSTIMAYAGICDTDDLQRNSDPQFHVGSFVEMRGFIITTPCAVLTATGNTAPDVTVPASGKVIPKGTPFKLTANGSDADADPLTFSWEEYDLGPAGSPNDPQVANRTPPLFRSFEPVASPMRYFPRLTDLVAGTTDIGERLPTVARTLRFVCTARDEHRGLAGIVGGVTASDSVNMRVSAVAGPFAVTAPNAALVWAGGSTQPVTWAVAGTTANNVNCATVNVRLSTDGGFTYPTLLAAGVPNNGSASVTVPSLTTTTARVMVEAADNFFFDISDANFTINTTVVCPAPTALLVDSLTTTTAVVRFTVAPGAVGYTVTTSPATTPRTVTGSPVRLTGLTPGTIYTVTIVRDCGPGATSGAATVSFTTPAVPQCAAPVEVALRDITSTTATVQFVATGSATSYVFTTVPATTVQTATASPVTLTGLLPRTSYVVRLRSVCGATDTSAVVVVRFTTLGPPPANDQCANALPLACGVPITGTTTDATAAGDPTGSCGTSIDLGGVFYSITGTGAPITVTNCGPTTSYDTKLFVFQGPCGGPYVCIDGNDDTDRGPCRTPSTVQFASVAGAPYWVFVSGYEDQSGDFDLLATCAPVGLPDASAAAALSISPNPVGAGAALRLTLAAAPAEPATATLRDVLGRRVGGVVSFRGLSAEVPTVGLAAGTYLLEVRVSGQAPVVRRVVVE